jgi:REP element-mobilizing transposase RayT
MGIQLDFGFKKRRRRRAARRGRPRKPGRIPHAKREVHPRLPLHVTVRMRPEVWNLRSRRSWAALEKAFFHCLGRDGARVAQFSVQGNHVHLLVEATDRLRLGRMMQVFGIRAAKGMNKVMGRKKGTVLAERYHARILRTPTETRAALVYVLQNARKHLTAHGIRLQADFVDVEFSSAEWFDGWAEHPPPSTRPPLVGKAGTWLLDRGWRERGGGPIRRAEMPRG